MRNLFWLLWKEFLCKENCRLWNSWAPRNPPPWKCHVYIHFFYPLNTCLRGLHFLYYLHTTSPCPPRAPGPCPPPKWEQATGSSLDLLARVYDVTVLRIYMRKGSTSDLAAGGGWNENRRANESGIWRWICMKANGMRGKRDMSCHNSGKV